MMTKFISALILMSWASVTDAQAWDSEPDPETGKYDKYFDRPTHFPDWHQPSTWANNMAYFVAVRIGDSEERLENYEIAVYDQNNCLRHCGRSYPNDGNLCALTIMGTEGDEFHFRIIYGDDFDHPIIKTRPGLTVPFETDFVTGNKVTPYWMTLPTATTERDSEGRAFSSSHILRTQEGFKAASETEEGTFATERRNAKSGLQRFDVLPVAVGPMLYIVDGKKYFVK